MTRIDALRASERDYNAFPRPRRITVRVKQMNFNLPACSTNALFCSHSDQAKPVFIFRNIGGYANKTSVLLRRNNRGRQPVCWSYLC